MKRSQGPEEFRMSALRASFVFFSLPRPDARGYYIVALRAYPVATPTSRGSHFIMSAQITPRTVLTRVLYRFRGYVTLSLFKTLPVFGL